MIKIVSDTTFIKRVELRATTVTLRSDNIMHFDIKPVDEYFAKDVQEVLDTVKEMGKEKKFLNMITVKQYVAFHKDARTLSASEAGNIYTIADAIVVNSVALKLAMNLYLSFDKPVKPTKGFSSEEKAVEWLKSFS